MAKDNTIATAYVQIKPSMEGIKGELGKGFDAEGQAAAKSFGNGFSGAMSTVAKGAVAAIGTATAAAGALTKKAVEGYAEYEQLVGGVETLFGAQGMSLEEYAKSQSKTVSEVKSEYNGLLEAQEKIFSSAEEAYKKAGMSANDYMETVNGFAASLIQSTGRGEQIDIDAYKKELEEEYIAAKRNLQDQYDARKDSYKAQADIIKSSGQAEVKALQEQKKAELATLKKGDKAAYEAAKKSWDDRIALAKSGTTAEKSALSDQKAGALKDLKRSQEDELRALKQHHKDLLAEAEAANNVSIKTPESVKEAADLAEMAAVDMSDNANKMGTAMESIQNAYQGFAKQNFTMLDNLKLGYGGTKEEMQRLLNDASKLTGENLNLNSLADIIKGIHAIQEEMGIAGTTQEEATETISGSIGMLQAAWENLIVGIADKDADLGGLIDNLVDSASVAFGNLLPVMEQAFMGLAELIEKLLPVIMDELPSIINRDLPKLLEIGVSVVGTIGKGILDNLPAILDIATQLILNISSGLSEALPELIPAVTDMILTITSSLLDNAYLLTDAAIVLMEAFADGYIAALPVIIDKTPELVDKLVEALIDNMPKIVLAVAKITVAMGEAFIESGPAMLEAGKSILGSFIEGTLAEIPAAQSIISGIGSMLFGSLGQKKDNGTSFDVSGMLQQLGADISAGIDSIVRPLQEKVAAVIGGVVEVFKPIGTAIGAIAELVMKIWNKVVAFLTPVINSLGNLVNTVFTGIGVLIGRVMDSVMSKVTSIWNSIVSFITPILNKIQTTVASVWDAISTKIETVLSSVSQFINSIWTSIVTTVSQKIEEIKTFISDGFAALADLIREPLESFAKQVMDTFEGIKTKISDFIEKAKTWGMDMIQNFIDGITGKRDDLANAINGIAEKIREIIGFSEPELGPLSNFHTFAPDMMELFARGIRENENIVAEQVKRSFDFGGQITAVDNASRNSPVYSGSPADLAVSDTQTRGLSEQFSQAVTLLGQLVDKDPVEIGADATGIFNLVRRQNSRFTMANGRSAFAI